MKWKMLAVIFAMGIGAVTFQNCQGDLDALEKVDSQLRSSSSEDFTAASAALTRPNILMIMLDDAGQGDWLDPKLAPKIAQFKNKATLFTHFYVNPMCSPTRISMLSGHSHVDYSVLWVCGSNAVYGIPSEDKTFPEVLSEKGGYLTSTIGKWHSGSPSPELTKSADFSIAKKFSFYKESQGVVSNGYFNPQVDENGTKKSYPGMHLTNVTAKNVIDRINYHQKNTPNKPFYIQHWLNAPHGPHLPDPAFIPNTDPFKTSYLNFLASNPGAVSHPFLKNNKRKLYEYLIKQADDRIGKVLDLINNSNDPYLKNTIIMITSDNGGTKDTRVVDGAYGNIDLTGPSPRDLRGFKTDVYEGGIRQHLIVKYKNQQTRAINRSNLSLLDLYPTILELAGVTADASYGSRLQGKSFAQLIKAPTSTLVRNHPQYWAFKARGEHLPKDSSGNEITQGFDKMSFAMRQGPWKLVVEPEMPDEPAGSHSCSPCLFYFENGYNRESAKDDIYASNKDQGLLMREMLREWYLSSTQMPIITEDLQGGVVKTEGSIPGFKKGGPREKTVSFTFPNTTSNRFSKLKFNYMFDVNRLDFTLSGSLKLSVDGKTQIIASRPGTWILRVNSSNKLEVVTYDKKSVPTITTSPYPIAKNMTYDIGFHIYSFKSAPSIVKIFSRNANEELSNEDRLTLQIRKEVSDGLKSNNETIYIGAKPGLGTSFSGQLQNVRLYHTPLRQADINYGMRRWGNIWD